MAFRYSTTGGESIETRKKLLEHRKSFFASGESISSAHKRLTKTLCYVRSRIAVRNKKKIAGVYCHLQPNPLKKPGLVAPWHIVNTQDSRQVNP